METHSSVLAWKIPRTEESGGLQSMGCKELDMTEHAHTHTPTGLTPKFMLFSCTSSSVPGV